MIMKQQSIKQQLWLMLFMLLVPLGAWADRDVNQPQFGKQVIEVANDEVITFYDPWGTEDIDDQNSYNAQSLTVFKPAEVGMSVQITFEKIDLYQYSQSYFLYINLYDGIADADNSFTWTSIYAVISIIPWSNDPDAVLSGSYTAKIYDLELVGNCSVDFDGDISGSTPVGITSTGIAIGSAHQPSLYYVDVKNVSVSKCDTGLSLKKIVGNGLVEGVKINNCYHNGIDIGSSIVKLKDLTFGSCGSSAMELIPAEATESGENLDQVQTVTLEGYINVENNNNNGNTSFFKHYKIAGYEIPTIINGLLAQFDETTISHMRNDKGEFKFVCFILCEFADFSQNPSVLNYPAYQEGGIINATDLPKGGEELDTVHQYISLDVDLTVMGLPNVGKVLLYNHNCVS